MYPFHQQVQEFFPSFDYRNPSDSVRRRCDMSIGPENVVGHQQRAVTCYWALQTCGPMDLGIDFGSSKGMTPHCIHVDIFGDGNPHPFYGGGRYLADIIRDASDLSLYPRDAYPFIASNHSLEHMKVGNDQGIIELLLGWFSLLRSGGVLAMVIPDNAHFDVMASDKDHRHAWSAYDFKPRVLDSMMHHVNAELVGYDTLQNKFSFDVVLRKR